MGTGSGKMWKKFRMRNALVPENSQDRDIRQDTRVRARL